MRKRTILLCCGFAAVMISICTSAFAIMPEPPTSVPDAGILLLLGPAVAGLAIWGKKRRK
jgi:hypothetical protein